MTREIILGPPGTGKTWELLDIVDEELERGTPPERIGYLSFTRRASMEATTRACEKFNLTRKQFQHFRTLHSLCYRQMRLQSDDVFERNHTREFANHVGIRISDRFSTASEEGVFASDEAGDRILFMENLSRVRCVPLREQYDGHDDNLSWWEVERVERALRAYKKEHGLVDYTDMLLDFAKGDDAPALDVVLIDEAQDLSQVQWRVVHRLERDARRCVVAGDDDQAIYAWAGADVDYFIGLQGDVRTLRQSHRVPKTVQSLAASIADEIENRREKKWTPRRAEGAVVHVPDMDAVDLSTGDVLVLARNIYLLSAVRERIRAAGYLYEYRGQTSVAPSILRAIVNWERLRRGDDVEVTEIRNVYDKMSSGTGVARGYKKLPGFEDSDMVGIADLQERGGLLRDDIWHDALERVAAGERAYLLQALRQSESLTGDPRIRLSTIHGAKGGQADHVVLLTDMAQRTYSEMWKDRDSESRVWYVAVTRAKEKLTIIEPRTARHHPVFDV